MKVTAAEHEMIAEERIDANIGIDLGWGYRSKMKADLKRIENRYWRVLGGGSNEGVATIRPKEAAQALAFKLRQMANAIDHDLKQLEEDN